MSREREDKMCSALLRRKWLKSLFVCKILSICAALYALHIFASHYFCIYVWYQDITEQPRPHVICADIQGRLANAMFQHAFLLHYSKIKNLHIVHTGEVVLKKVFELDHGIEDSIKVDPRYCGCILAINDRWDCSFDNQFKELPVGKDMKPFGYFQSWKYWKESENEVRKLFTFLPEIRNIAKSKLSEIVGNDKDSTLIGIHIRRGDYVKNSVFINFGYTVATDLYLYKAMNTMRKKYGKVIYIVCSNDMSWSKDVLSDLSDSEIRFVEGNTPEVDLAILSLTQHSIITVGTYGWWAAWLANGTTIYYEFPFREGTDFMTQFRNQDTSDFFYPGWIAMS